jgi:hypothetical protein
MQKSLATAEEEHRKILMTLLSVLRRRLETSQKRLGKFQYVASLLIGEVDRLEKERIKAGKLQRALPGMPLLENDVTFAYLNCADARGSTRCEIRPFNARYCSFKHVLETSL